MALFGYAAARWTAQDDLLAWPLTIDGFVIVMLIAAALLEGRLVSNIAATIAVWSGVTLYDGSMTSMLVFGMGGFIGLFLVIRQSRNAVGAAVRDRKSQRLNSSH